MEVSAVSGSAVAASKIEGRPDKGSQRSEKAQEVARDSEARVDARQEGLGRRVDTSA